MRIAEPPLLAPSLFPVSLRGPSARLCSSDRGGCPKRCCRPHDGGHAIGKCSCVKPQASSRARTLTFSPASIRRRASSLNSRLNRLGSLVVKPVLLPRKENCHHFPCLKLGVHSRSYRTHG